MLRAFSHTSSAGDAFFFIYFCNTVFIQMDSTEFTALHAFSAGNTFVPFFIQVDADSLRTYGGAFTASNALALIPTDQSLAAVALRIGAPLTAEGASGQKYGCPDALAIINGKRLQLHYIAFYAH